jgi:hypothetical protein
MISYILNLLYLNKKTQKSKPGMVHTCNPSYLGGRGRRIMNLILACSCWLAPVILATQEAEMKRMVIQCQPKQIVHKTLSQKHPTQKGLVEWINGLPSIKP